MAIGLLARQCLLEVDKVRQGCVPCAGGTEGASGNAVAQAGTPTTIRTHAEPAQPSPITGLLTRSSSSRGAADICECFASQGPEYLPLLQQHVIFHVAT